MPEHGGEKAAGLTRLCERLADLREKVQDAKFATDDLGLAHAHLLLHTAERAIEDAWQEAERALVTGRIGPP